MNLPRAKLARKVFWASCLASLRKPSSVSPKPMISSRSSAPIFRSSAPERAGGPCARSIAKKRHPFMSTRSANPIIASAAAPAGRFSVSSWIMNTWIFPRRCAGLPSAPEFHYRRGRECGGRSPSCTAQAPACIARRSCCLVSQQSAQDACCAGSAQISEIAGHLRRNCQILAAGLRSGLSRRPSGFSPRTAVFDRGNRPKRVGCREGQGARCRGQRPGSAIVPRFRGRVIFPIRNDYGEVIAFSGRVLNPGAKSAKYVNSPETPLFTKGRVLYGLDKSKRALIEANTAIVCEGQLDLISAFEAGVQNVIAPQGTAFTPVQARLLGRFVESVILCFDSDQAGREAIGRSLPALLECGLDVRVASLPEGEDPDSLIRRRGVSRFREVIDGAPGFFDHALERLSQEGTLDNPAGKSSAARQLGPLVAMIKDPVLREATANRICARLGITETAFVAHLKPIALAATTDSTESSKAIPLPLNEGLRQLCRLGLHARGIPRLVKIKAATAIRHIG